MNHSDSERIAAKLNKAGHKLIKADSSAKASTKADLIVLNACSVRQSAMHRVFAQIQKLRDKKIIIAGCVLPTDKKILSSAKNITFWHPDEYVELNPLRQNKFSAFLPIMTGCNNFCSYCVVPSTRGQEKSRPAKTIIAEAKLLIKNGIKEIILLGQNVNSYKDSLSLRSLAKQSREMTTLVRDCFGLRPRNDKINFTALLRLLNALPGNFWLSFLTSHPKDMSDELIAILARCQKITPYIHLPVQSGDDKILRAMNRHYTVAHYKKLIKKLRSAFKRHRPSWPPLAISTDVIVGFPGETRQQFQNTLRLIKEIKFDMIYFARYSPRPGTVATKLTDNVPQSEKKRRAQAINQLLKQIATQLNKKYIGRTVPVLINSSPPLGGAGGDFVFGKTITNKNVKLPAGKLKCGQIVDVRIVSATAWGLKGK